MKKYWWLGFILIAAGIGYYVLRSDYTAYTPPQKMTKASMPKIPQTLLQVRWLTGDEEKIFSRIDRNSVWIPQNQNNNNLELLEKTLPLIPPQDSTFEVLPLPKHPLVQVGVTFDNITEEWLGGFDGKNFVWLSGSLKGYGKVLSKTEAALFYAGRFAFDNKRVDWCPSRIKVFEKEGAYKYEYIGNKWHYSAKEEKPEIKLVKEKKFEDWISRNCTFFVDQFVDPKISSLSSIADQSYLVKFAKYDFKFKVGSEIFSFGDRYFISSHFLNSLNETH